jgi:hypothetical protein
MGQNYCMRITRFCTIVPIFNTNVAGMYVAVDELFVSIVLRWIYSNILLKAAGKIGEIVESDH